MKYSEAIGTPHEKEKDPLTAVHNVKVILREIQPYLTAMDTLGLSCADEIRDILWVADDYCVDCAEGIVRETTERLNQAQEGTANMLNALVTGITIGKEGE